MVLTEKVRAKISGGETGLMVVYHVTGLAAGANNISAPTLGMHNIIHGDFWPEVSTTSANAASVFPILGTFEGTHVTVTTCPTDGAGDSGTLMAWGN